MRHAVLVFLFLLLTSCAMTADNAALRNEFAPSGALKVGVNYGNPTHTQPDPSGGAPRGVAPDLARELARRLGVPVQYVTFDAAGKMAEALKNGEVDLVFLAVDPERAAEIAFSQPYLEIYGTYLVRKDSPFKALEDVDRPGVRIIVGTRSAYDLHLTRAIKHAKLERGGGGLGYLADWRKGGYDAAAGVREALLAEARQDPGTRVLPGHFMVIPQAVGVPKGRPAAARYLDAYVAEMKASGFVRKALDASGFPEAVVPR